MRKMQEIEHMNMIREKQTAERAKTAETTEDGRRKLHKMWAKEQARISQGADEIQKGKEDKKKQERRAKKQLEKLQAEEAEARLEELQNRMLAGKEMKRQVRDTWAKDQDLRKQRRDSLANQEKAAAKALAQRKRWMAEEAQDQKLARIDLTKQIEAERATQNLQEQQAKSDRMVQHTELALHSAMVQKHEKMMAMKQLEQQWNDRVANRHTNYKEAWAQEHRVTEMFRQQRNKQVGKYYRLQTPDKGTVDVRMTRSGTTIGSRPVPSATAMHSVSPMSVTSDARSPIARLSVSHPLPYKYGL